MTIGRRAALLGLTSVATCGGALLAMASTPGDKRFVVVIQRGAMDGMAAVVPHGDPGLTALRGATPEGLLDLGGFYGLHPALAGLHAMYQAHEFVPVHAVAGSYRVRSHFEAQDYLESGADHRMTSGWLNRVVGAMGGHAPGGNAPSGNAPGGNAPGGNALSVGVSVPLLLRGAAPVGNWAPHGMIAPPPDLYAAIAAMNRADPVIGPAIAAGMKERGFSDRALMGEPHEANRFAFPSLAASAGTMMRAPDGPRIAAMEIGGWDTHTAQTNRLTFPLRQLDAGMVALKTALGDAWKQTVVLVMTEFGRTARINGTGGTDHGTAGVAFVLGGAVKGGRVQADWPGLGPSQLFENRDLAPTADLRSIAKGLLSDHLGLNATALEQVFPASKAAAPMRGLIG